MNRIDAMLESVAAETLAVQQRRKGRRQEWNTHVELVSLMREHIASCVFWSSLDNAPRSMLGALHARRRAVRAGLPDLMVIVRGLPPIFVELKSIRGIPSAAQRKIAAELMAAGCSYSMCRSARSALATLWRAGVPFKGRWKPPRKLETWEGPFDAAAALRRLPQHPAVARERRIAQQRYRQRRHEIEAAKLVERGDAAGDDIAP